MTIYRGTTGASVFIELDSGPPRRLIIKKNDEYDDDDPVVAAAVARFPSYFRADNIEQATAAPGEKRNTRRG